MAIIKKSMQIINAKEGVEKREPSYAIGGNVNLFSHYRKQYGCSLKKKMEAPHDPAIPLLGIYLEKTTIVTKRYMYPMFLATLFTIAKPWKQPKCPSIN